MNARYTVVAYVNGSEDAHEFIPCVTLREARGVAWRLALAYRLKGGPRPVWCDGGAWHDDPDVPRAEPVGGWDLEGSAIVIFQARPARHRVAR